MIDTLNRLDSGRIRPCGIWRAPCPGRPISRREANNGRDASKVSNRARAGGRRDATLGFSRRAAAQTYGPDEGTELLPGVRQVDLSQEKSVIPAYETVSMRDIVVEPGASIPSSPMENDMVCHMTEGELRVVQDGREFTARKGDVWTCAIGTEEGGENASDTVAIMRVTDLLRG